MDALQKAKRERDNFFKNHPNLEKHYLALDEMDKCISCIHYDANPFDGNEGDCKELFKYLNKFIEVKFPANKYVKTFVVTAGFGCALHRIKNTDIS